MCKMILWIAVIGVMSNGACSQPSFKNLSHLRHYYVAGLLQIAFDKANADHSEAYEDIQMILLYRPTVASRLLGSIDMAFSTVAASGDERLADRGVELAEAMLAALWNNASIERPEELIRPRPPAGIGLDGVTPDSISDPDVRRDYIMYLHDLAAYRDALNSWHSQMLSAKHNTNGLLSSVRRIAGLVDKVEMDDFVMRIVDYTGKSENDVRRALGVLVTD